MGKTLSDLQKILEERLKTLEFKIKYLNLSETEIDKELDAISDLRQMIKNIVEEN